MTINIPSLIMLGVVLVAAAVLSDPLIILLFIALIIVPGFFLSRLFLTPPLPLEVRIIIATGMGIALIPFVSYLYKLISAPLTAGTILAFFALLYFVALRITPYKLRTWYRGLKTFRRTLIVTNQLNTFHIIFIVMAGVVSIAYILNSGLSKQEDPSLPAFIREPTPQDVQPMLEVGDREDNEFEDWWYAAVLKGSDGVTYVFRVYIDNIPRIRFVFKELNKEIPSYTIVECLHFERQKTAQGVVINCFQQDEYRIQAVVRAPDNSELSFFTPQGTLQLNFESRGLPYWFKNEFVFRNGFEDFTTVSGALTRDGKKIQLEGYGVFEKMLFDVPQHQDKSYLIWHAINFDQGYVFLFEIKSNKGYTARNAVVSINGDYSYINDPTKITIEHTSEDQAVKETHFIVETDRGKFESYGTFLGAMGSQVLLHAHTGTFTYNNGRVLELSGGIDIFNRRFLPKKLLK